MLQWTILCSSSRANGGGQQVANGLFKLVSGGKAGGPAGGLGVINAEKIYCIARTGLAIAVGTGTGKRRTSAFVEVYVLRVIDLKHVCLTSAGQKRNRVVSNMCGQKKPILFSRLSPQNSFKIGLFLSLTLTREGSCNELELYVYYAQDTKLRL